MTSHDLRRIRLYAGWTTRQAARALEVTHLKYRAWERGRSKIPQAYQHYIRLLTQTPGETLPIGFKDYWDPMDITLFRDSLDITKTTFAQWLNISRRTLYQWERGLVEPSEQGIMKLNKLAETIEATN